MKLVCPSCGAVASAEAWANDAAARQCLRIVAELPGDVGRRCLPYLALFRPLSGRGMSWQRCLRLLSELAGLVNDSYVQWESRPARPNSAAAWTQAMERMIQQPPRQLPMRNHNYLRTIAYEIANESDRQAEVRHNKAERSGDVPQEQPEWKPDAVDFEKLRAAVRGVGRKI